MFKVNNQFRLGVIEAAASLSHSKELLNEDKMISVSI